MEVIQHPNDIFQYTSEHKRRGGEIGLVPTMGALHDGHFSLVREARKANDLLVVSVFVNPLQFNNDQDLINYPRSLQADVDLLRKYGADVVYAPEPGQMYPEKPVVSLTFGPMADVMEGSFRPGHFSGVGVVVSKLFHHTNPDRAYFGLKDLQQFLLVRRMAKDLSFPVEVIGLPIVREASGLALSSRNSRLSSGGRELAGSIHQGLLLGKDLWEDGKSPNETKMAVNDFYKDIKGLQPEYVALVDPENLQDALVNDSQPVALCVAAYVEGIRLIDNLYLRPRLTRR